MVCASRPAARLLRTAAPFARRVLRYYSTRPIIRLVIVDLIIRVVLYYQPKADNPADNPAVSFVVYITPVTKKSLPLGNSSAGRSWEKKFEKMRGRPSIGFELTRDELENLVFPQAVEEKFKQLGVSVWDVRHSMEAKLVGKVILFNFIPPPHH